MKAREMTPHRQGNAPVAGLQNWVTYLRGLDALFDREADQRGQLYVQFGEDDLLAAARIAARMGLAPTLR